MTTAQIKADMPDVQWGTGYDASIGVFITRASRLADAELGRKPGAFYVSADEVRYYTGDSRQDLRVDELADVPTEVAVNETAGPPSAPASYSVWDPTWYWCEPTDAPLHGMPYTLLHIDLLTSYRKFWYPFYRGVRVTGKFGFSLTPPAEIVQAVEIQVVRWFKRSQQAYADVGAVHELNQLRYVKKLDPEVQEILEAPRFQRVAL